MKTIIVLAVVSLASISAFGQVDKPNCERFPPNDDKLQCLLLSFENRFQPEALELCNRHNMPGTMLACLNIIKNRRYSAGQLARCDEAQCQDAERNFPGEGIIDLVLGDKMNNCLKRRR